MRLKSRFGQFDFINGIIGMLTVVYRTALEGVPIPIKTSIFAYHVNY